MKKASLKDYMQWFEGYTAKGGKPTHAYTYEFINRDWLVATKDFYLGGECGANSKSIVVMPGVKWLGGDLGHNSLYFMDDYRYVGSSIPVFNDICFRAVDSKGVVQRMFLEELRRDAIREIHYTDQFDDEDDFEEKPYRYYSVSDLPDKHKNKKRIVNAINDTLKENRVLTNEDVDKIIGTKYPSFPWPMIIFILISVAFVLYGIVNL